MKTLFTIIISLLLVAGTANAATVNGHNVGVIQVGNIGSNAIVSLTIDGAIYSDHTVNCPHPRRLHVVKADTKTATIFACSNYHHYRMP